MQEINNIAILGAGALGAAYASLFLDTGNFSVSFIARGERYERLLEQLVIVNGKSYEVPVIHPNELSHTADLIIVALKHHQLADAIPDLANFIGEQTVILSVLNGLDSEAMIGAKHGMEKMLYCVAVGIDAVRDKGTVTYSTVGKLIFGEAHNHKPSERVQMVQLAFDLAGIGHETPANMLQTMWWKFMVNVGVNQASAVMRAPYGVFQTSPDAQALMVTLMREVVVLSQHAGIGLTETAVEEWFEVLQTLSPDGKTSMLQDIEAGRQTEVDIFAGKVVELGEKYGVPTPINETMLHIIRVLEQQKMSLTQSRKDAKV
jgi:2-dehydropantoate 2-reductase